ncbi:MAG TPA: M23 family metallopeptidase [Patescibacteria group bacterium]|jgi:murein DD-endopeptidase MepM/ murein hydrolase activator NlpD
MYRSLPVFLLALCLAAPVPALAVTLPVERYFTNQTLKGYGTVVDDAYHERHRDLFPNNGFPNRFTGIHAAVDVEFTRPADARREVPVRAVTGGTVIYVDDVAGYGGLVIVRHAKPEPVTSLYGHIRLRDVPVKVGQRVREGQRIATLGAPFSAEISGARKHLHFGIHKGPGLDIAGHEQTRERLLAEWYNPNDWLRRHGAMKTPDPAPTATSASSPEPATEPATEQKTTWFDKIIDWFRNLFS